MSEKYKALERRAALLARRLRQGELRLQEHLKVIPSKKKSKPKPYKLQNTFEKNLSGVPGGAYSRNRTIGIQKMIEAPNTGCRTTDKTIGAMKSARNCNTTSGSYVTTIVRNEDKSIASDLQGRKAFGR